MAPQFLAQFFDLLTGIFHGPLIYNLTRNREKPPINYKKTVLIYNPQAGRFGRGGTHLVEQIVGILKQQGHHVAVAPTTAPCMAGRLAREHIQQGADFIIAAGGDGTINEVAEGMVHTAVPLAILPAGTANVLAMEMGLGRDLLRTARRLHELHPHRIAVGHVDAGAGRLSRHFLLMAGIGVDAHIAYHVNPRVKATAGKVAYWLAGFSILGQSLAPLQAEIDGRKRPCAFALISRVRNYGGDFEIARAVSLFDDDFEIVLFEGRTAAGFVKYLLGMAMNRLSGMKGVTVLRADRITITGPPDRRVYIQIDGESAGNPPADIHIVRDALTLLVPPEYEKRRTNQ